MGIFDLVKVTPLSAIKKMKDRGEINTGNIFTTYAQLYDRRYWNEEYGTIRFFTEAYTDWVYVKIEYFEEIKIFIPFSATAVFRIVRVRDIWELRILGHVPEINENSHGVYIII